MGARTDAELLAAIADGDRDALRAIHDRHAAWIMLRLQRRCSDTDVVAEAVPTFEQPAATPTTSTPTTSPTTVEAIEVAAPVADTVPDTAPDFVPDTAPPAAPAVAEIVVEVSGSFIDGDHPTSGVASVLGNGTGQRFLRFEEFATDNGPDLNVYLVNSATGDVSDYIDLGDLSGNIGDQNYEIPEGIDLDVYDQVVIWCVRFGVGFGSAQLS